ncbi:MAG: DUF58 domain-containing protein [Myxococcales bacterium]|nr:DUF58 domain-containing protein [Myxococcales bacterium]
MLSSATRRMHDLRRRLAPGLRTMRVLRDAFPVTLRGQVLVALGVAALSGPAYGTLDLVSFVAGWAALLLTGSCLLAVVGVGVATFVRLRPTGRDRPLEMETGRSTPSGFAMRFRRGMPLVRLDARPIEPAGIEAQMREQGDRLEEWLTAACRGEHGSVLRRLVCEDAFGLCRIAVHRRDPLALFVEPHVGALGRLHALPGFVGGEERPHPMGLDDGDRTELRRYVAGDSVRFVHWKLYARTRQWMVRIPERALSVARRAAGYLVAGESDEASAGAARAAVQSGALGHEWVFGADGSNELARDVRHARALVVSSAAARDQGGLGLASFAARVERTGPASFVLFVPSEPGPWLDRVVAFCRARPARVRVVVGLDGLPVPPPPRWRRWLMRTTVPPQRHGIDSVLHALHRAGASVLLLDRATGRAHVGPRWLAATRTAA